MKLFYQSYAWKGLEREKNEDAFGDPEHFNIPFFCVADGVASLELGEVASQTSIDIFGKVLNDNLIQNEPDREKILLKAVDITNGELGRIKHIKLEKNEDNLGSTIIGLLFSGRSYILGWLGDSHFYHIRDNAVFRQSTDHNDKIKTNAITRFLYSDSKNVAMKPMEFIHENDVRDGDKFILCSDGVTKYFDDNEILLITKEWSSSSKVAEKIVDRIAQNGAADNIALITIKVKE